MDDATADKLADAAAVVLEMGADNGDALKLLGYNVTLCGQVLAEQIRPDDRLSFVAPVVFDDRTGKMPASLLVLTDDRVIFAWSTGMRRSKQHARALPLSHVTDVSAARRAHPRVRTPTMILSFRAEGETFEFVFLSFMKDAVAFLAEALLTGGVRAVWSTEEQLASTAPSQPGPAPAPPAPPVTAPAVSERPVEPAAPKADRKPLPRPVSKPPAPPRLSATARKRLGVIAGVLVGAALLVAVVVGTVAARNATIWADVPDDGTCYTGGPMEVAAHGGGPGSPGGAVLRPVDCDSDQAYYTVTGHLDGLTQFEAEAGPCDSAIDAESTDLAWYDAEGRQARVHGNYVLPGSESKASQTTKGTVVCLGVRTGA
jgi:hypothetical protein